MLADASMKIITDFNNKSKHQLLVVISKELIRFKRPEITRLLLLSEKFAFSLFTYNFLWRSESVCKRFRSVYAIMQPKEASDRLRGSDFTLPRCANAI